MATDHIHTPYDKRGARAVYVDGKKIEKAFYADTQRGIVDCYQHPPKPDRWKKRALTRRFRGKVEIVYLDQ